MDTIDRLRNATMRLFGSSPRESETFYPTSPKLLATPSSSSASKFSLPSADSSRSSSSISSSSSFWTSHSGPSTRPLIRCLPASWRNTITKRQAAVLTCMILAIVVWFCPPPRMWHRRVSSVDVHYHALRPAGAESSLAQAPDPLRWLEGNSKNRHARSETGVLSSLTSKRPRAALISLVRNSELNGMMQSMRQLEHQWNRKYQYPWIFFNDEPFSDEFKVRDLWMRRYT